MMRHLLQLAVLVVAALVVGVLLARRRRGGVLALFALLAVGVTYPLAFSPTKVMLDSGGATDAFIFFWNSWWVKKALLDLQVNPFYTDYIYYPHGTTLTLHSLALLYALVSIPFQLIWPGETGIYVANNLVILGSFWLAGYAAYRLAWHLIEDRPAAILAGLAYALCNFHFANTVRLHALALEWIPIFILCLLRFQARGRLRDGAWLGLSSVGVFYASLEYCYFLVLWTAIYVIWQAARVRGRLPGQLARGLPGLAVAVAIAAVLTLPYWVAFTRENEWEHPVLNLAEVDDTCVDLVDFVQPNARHPLYGESVSAYQRAIHDGDDGLGLGFSYAVLLLAAVGTGAAFRNRLAALYIWVVTWVLFAMLSMGPVLHVAGNGTSLVLPYGWLWPWLPLLQHLQMPIRFIVLVHLAMAILSAYGLSRIRARLPGIRPVWLLAPAYGLVLFETLSAPMTVETVRVPQVYHQLGEMPGDAAVLDWPPGREQKLMCEVWHQCVHGKRLVQDLASFIPRVSYQASTEVRSPQMRQLEISILGGELLSRLDARQRKQVVRHNLDTLARLNVRYIILRKNDLSLEGLASCRNNIAYHRPAAVGDLEGGILVSFEFPADE